MYRIGTIACVFCLGLVGLAFPAEMEKPLPEPWDYTLAMKKAEVKRRVLDDHKPPDGEKSAARELVHYVRPAADTFATECKLLITKKEEGWTITSWTDRGTVQMEVETSYDPEDRPTAAKAVLKTQGRAKTVTVQVKDGKATVQREDLESVQLDAPKGTIITSAPDWTDVFLLCRRYDRQRKGRQEFPALWIHPTQAPQRLTFSIEWQGSESIESDGKKTELGRYLIRIRNNSSYAAWTDAQGRMVRLIPLPLKETATGLTLEGYEKAAAGLRPPPTTGNRKQPVPEPK